MKNMKFVVGIVVVCLSGIGGFFWWQQNQETPPEEIHFHAGFQVYVNNTQEDFSNFKYMQVKPCGEDAHDEDPQMEKAHLHDGVGDVVHAHANGGTWTDLFQNISYIIPEDVVGYVNGQMVPQILSMPILPNSSVVFFVGENSDREKKVENRVTQEHIQEVEQKSENCGKS